ncbi:helix-turn-helix domain-containing protein [Micavibrio aeruginosavorus]|uniref:Helix-turn-helix family protein n=1 Tax=Micavibrio aeruginosavorus (strain ARL-13) TaxID=856793 RepID=G2KQK9_MICAA|nr:helix-turn-helix transcriptional regulator [Micavibrio aeruginosavorus]AEP09937.1 helix-turn-helix family protein [Micavibrio aeruginosavorus ARL-13]
MITPDQIRAARALKGWSQTELANRANVAVPSIANIELGKQKPSAQMLDKIYEAFLLAGIVFTKNGVEKRSFDERITTFSQEDFPGQNLYLSVLEDVYLTLKDLPEVERIWYVFVPIDEISPPAVVEQIRKIRSAGIQIRNIVNEDDTYLMGDFDEYRLIPKNLFVNSISMVYGTKFAMTLDSSFEKPEPGAVIIINDENAANAQRGVFEVLWQTLPKPEKSTAREKY